MRGVQYISIANSSVFRHLWVKKAIQYTNLTVIVSDKFCGNASWQQMTYEELQQSCGSTAINEDDVTECKKGKSMYCGS